MVVLNPQGPVGVREAALIAITFGVMMLIVVPVFIMTGLFAWRYRAGWSPRYEPSWARSWKIEFLVWAVPVVMIVFLGTLNWRSTHRLDPYRPLDAPGPALRVQVVAMDWKWLFIYPDLHIATVNQLVIPTGTQISFLITSDSVMNVFFIPQLGTQIYAMAGMQTQVHLLAKNAGDYLGESANFSGPGFANMHFVTRAMRKESFADWVKMMQAAPGNLDNTQYQALERPSERNAVQAYGNVAPGLFAQTVMKNTGGMSGTME